MNIRIENAIKTLAQYPPYKLTHIPYRLFVARPSGYEKAPEPTFDVGIFGWFDYTPKKRYKFIKTMSVKSQRQHNNCTDQSTTVQTEVKKKKVLSARALSAYKRSKGLLSGNGWSTTDNAQKGVRDFGIPEEKDCPDVAASWDVYANTQLLTPELARKAAENKIDSYWSVKSRNERLKLLDDDEVLVASWQWYTGFNTGGGFSYPYVMSKFVGLPVGGHQIAKIGFIFGYLGIDRNTQRILIGDGGLNVYVYQNSYDRTWGATFIDPDGNKFEGCFFVTMDFFDRVYMTCVAQLDIERVAVDIAMQYDNQNVKVEGDNAIYRISMGKKRLYPIWDIFAAWGGYTEGFQTVKKEDLDKVPKGDDMMMDNAPYKDVVQNLIPPIKWKYPK